jgi:hypothetical protein
VGVALRIVQLDRVPPGFNQDEACSAVEAYSILRTGRDHHGRLLPIAVTGFNDYRMPAFTYSLIPLEAAFGLKARTARLGAALWGSSDLVAMSLIALEVLGMPAAVFTAIVGAVSPWHLPLSRFGHDTIAAPATISWATLLFIVAMRRRSGRLLLLAALCFGASLYTYSITKVFTPLFVVWLAIMNRRELAAMKKFALAGAGILAMTAAPLAWLTWTNSAEMQARFTQISVFASNPGLMRVLAAVAAGFTRQFSRGFLFVHGDPYAVNHPPGFGQLLPAQAFMLALALAALSDARFRRFVIFLLGWLVIAAVPGALTVPSPHALHDAMAMAPWTLLAALGLQYMLDFNAWRRMMRVATVALILTVFAMQAAVFLGFYFRDYPRLAAREFQYGLAQALSEVKRAAGSNLPVVITPTINQPYIYVLFYGLASPEQFQRGPVNQSPGLFASVMSFDRFKFTDPAFAFQRFAHGVFVFAGTDAAPVPPSLSIRYPNGEIAYQVVVK